MRDVSRHRRGAWVSVPRRHWVRRCPGAVLVAAQVTVDDARSRSASRPACCPAASRWARSRPPKVVDGALVSRLGHPQDGAWLDVQVSGRRAVKLALPDGRTFTIGSDQPEALLAAIEQARTRSARGGLNVERTVSTAPRPDRPGRRAAGAAARAPGSTRAAGCCSTTACGRAIAWSRPSTCSTSRRIAARETVLALAALQGTAYHALSEEEPGRIHNERRDMRAWRRRCGSRPSSVWASRPCGAARRAVTRPTSPPTRRRCSSCWCGALARREPACSIVPVSGRDGRPDDAGRQRERGLRLDRRPRRATAAWSSLGSPTRWPCSRSGRTAPPRTSTSAAACPTSCGRWPISTCRYWLPRRSRGRPTSESSSPGAPARRVAHRPRRDRSPASGCPSGATSATPSTATATAGRACCARCSPTPAGCWRHELLRRACPRRLRRSLVERRRAHALLGRAAHAGRRPRPRSFRPQPALSQLPRERLAGRHGGDRPRPAPPGPRRARRASSRRAC